MSGRRTVQAIPDLVERPAPVSVACGVVLLRCFYELVVALAALGRADDANASATTKLAGSLIGLLVSAAIVALLAVAGARTYSRGRRWWITLTALCVLAGALDVVRGRPFGPTGVAIDLLIVALLWVPSDARRYFAKEA
jgi:hypothetical protein